MARHSESRHFENPFADYKKGDRLLVTPDGKLHEDIAERVRDRVKSLLRELHSGISKSPFDESIVYTGTSGITYLYLHLHERFATEPKSAQEYLEVAAKFLGKPRDKRCTFLCGDAGVLALKAVLYKKLGRNAEVQESIQRLVGMSEGLCTDPKVPDELLYGRCGYLYSLLFVMHHLGHDSISSSVIQKMVKCIIMSGRRLSEQERSKCPLMYTWYGEHYLGAAHGLAGIFAVLLQVKDPEVQGLVESYVRPSIDYMETLMFDSGNSPPSLESHDKDKLIHWCHGAPGWVHMFAQAYLTFEDERYLNAAKRCAQVIWQRGLLRKGYGLCHGTGGNAYAFLTLYQLTQDPVYIHRAVKFAEWCFDYGSHGCRTPDTPYSMYEGMAGTIYFLVDLLNPAQAAFPALILPPKHG